MSTHKNEHNPELYKPDHFTEGTGVVHATRGWTGKVVPGSTEDRIRVDFGEHNWDDGSGKKPGLYWPHNLRRITPPTDTTGSGREGETGCGPKSGHCAECGTTEGALVLLEDTTLCEECNMADHVVKLRLIDELTAQVEALRWAAKEFDKQVARRLWTSDDGVNIRDSDPGDYIDDDPALATAWSLFRAAIDSAQRQEGA